VFFLTERRELFLEFRAVPEQLDELFILVTGLVRDSEDCLTARHIQSLDIMQAAALAPQRIE
jgi:hypothetical protein